MYVTPINSNNIEIPVFSTGCLKDEFDSTYPVMLNGIITPQEFEESIRNINQKFSRQLDTIFGSISVVFIFGAIVCFVVGGITAGKPSRFPPLVGVGFALFIVGMLFWTFGSCFLRARRTSQLRKAVATESMKYSTRSPIACSWRLNVLNYWTGYGRNRRRRIAYRLFIDIRYPTGSGNGNVPYQYNQFAPQSISYISQQNNPSAPPPPPPPPPYYDQSVARFCSRCGMPRQTIEGKFCSSCGQPFNM